MVPLLLCLILCCHFLLLWQNHPGCSLVCRQLCYLDNSQSLPLGMASLHLHQKQFTFPFLVERTPKPRISPPLPLPVLSYYRLKAFWEAAVVLDCAAQGDLQGNPPVAHQPPARRAGGTGTWSCPLPSQQMGPLLSLTTPALPGRCLQAPFLHAPSVRSSDAHSRPSEKENYRVSFDSFVASVTSGSLKRDNSRKTA